jgi:hypothetical protein
MARRNVGKAPSALVILALAAGCPGGSDGVTPGDECETDAQCGDLLCARDHVCEPPDQLRRLQIRWTVGQQTAGTSSCQGIASLDLSLTGPDDAKFGLADVLCTIGVFTIDRLSLRFDRVKLTAIDDRRREIASVDGAITSDEIVAVDLPRAP